MGLNISIQAKKLQIISTLQSSSSSVGLLFPQGGISRQTPNEVLHWPCLKAEHGVDHSVFSPLLEWEKQREKQPSQKVLWTDCVPSKFIC